MTIELEPLFFWEYYVWVYDEDLNLVLDKKYYCKGLMSATMTIQELTLIYPDAEIVYN